MGRRRRHQQPFAVSRLGPATPMPLLIDTMVGILQTDQPGDGRIGDDVRRRSANPNSSRRRDQAFVEPTNVDETTVIGLTYDDVARLAHPSRS